MVGLDAGLSGCRLSRATVAGIAIGLLGVALLVGPSAAGLDLVAVAAVLGGAIAWAAGSLYARRAPLPRRRDLSAGMEMLAAGILLGIAAVVTGEASEMHVPSVGALAAIAYLVVFGSLLAYTAYGWLLAHVPTKVVATHGYVNPVVAVALGCLLLGEPLTATTLVAGALVLLSVVLIVGLPKRERPLEPIPSAIRLPVPARSAFSRLAA
jgi:drug/metabolite transporter (DMT)-like permease